MGGKGRKIEGYFPLMNNEMHRKFMFNIDIVTTSPLAMIKSFRKRPTAVKKRQK